MMRRTVESFVVALVVGVLALAGCVPAYAAEDAAPAGGWVLASTGALVDVSETPACESEDQEYGPCLWDARVAGNGVGESFIVEEDGSVSYLRWRDAREVAFPGWLWVGRFEGVSTAGLPSCGDVHDVVSCERAGRYVLEVNVRACTQTITTVDGDRYVPGPAVAEAISEGCVKSPVKGHQDEAGLGGARNSVSMEVVHSASPSAVVEEPVVKVTSSSRDKVVGPVDSGVKGNYDVEVVVVFGALTLLGLAGGVWWQRRQDGRRVGRHGQW